MRRQQKSKPEDLLFIRNQTIVNAVGQKKTPSRADAEKKVTLDRWNLTTSVKGYSELLLSNIILTSLS